MKHCTLSLFTAIICLSASYTLKAQSDPFEMIRANPDLAAGVHHSYTYTETAETPVPKGYKPFYISHYGRHGSRRCIGSSATLAYEYMDKAKEAGLLTDLGEELYTDVEAIYQEHVGMIGQLTLRGGREHRGIAERMYLRTPNVFEERTEVYVQSSIIPRCLISMANFTASLDDRAPQLHFSFITGEKYYNLIAHDYYDGKEISSTGRRLQDSLLNARFNPDRFMKAIFVDSPEETVIDNPVRFIESVYYYGSISQCLDYPADIFGKYFTPEELFIQYDCYNVRTYNNMSNSEQFGDRVIWAAKELVQDIIDRAEAAIAGNTVAADLRFGHDSGILPLAGLIGIEGVSDRYPATEITKHWQSYERIPMASNMQFIFYRNGDGDILVKILYNEREAAIPALSAGPYYRWNDLVSHLRKRCESLNF